eukprot:CAMPEP_0197020854 /NCGR_PEP_ID=MMETSP1384-20130603/1719_1 /TAXON_ID=29189 /ORGANISM="Ammonia sp." /LENGTH=523 /DNA_ID=CAMNT_0042448561 /DNA_START=18 /DNA_END=1589 /DNA_ORIENTATION=-
MPKSEQHDYRGVMVRMESMSFRLPMFIGEICTCNARVTFTSKRSLEVQVTVIAENAMTGTKRHTNSARLWFVGIELPKSMKTVLIEMLDKGSEHVINIPALQLYRSNEYELGLERYQKQKLHRNDDQQLKILDAVDLSEWTDRLLSKSDFDKLRDGPTVFKLAQVTLPSDCFGTQSTAVDGGYVMKLMDNVAGSVGHSWARSRVVTIHINAINFHAPISAGNVCHCYGRLVFTSKRSMEIYVLTFVHDLREEESKEDKQVYKMLGQHRLKLVCAGFFTFVALDKQNASKTTDIPQFTPHSAFEKMVHTQAKLRYEQRKNARKTKQNIDSKQYKPTVVVGPSGVGKGTLLKALRARFPDKFAVAVSHTTRKARGGEVDGEHYHFVSKEQFESEIKEDKFIEYANTYGNLYGTSKKAVQDVMEQRKICLLEIDYVGAKSIKQSSLDANYLFITVDGEDATCKQRIEGRGTETKQQIEKRVKTAKKEFEFFRSNKDFFDAVISNDDLTKATAEIIQVFQKWYEWLE